MTLLDHFYTISHTETTDRTHWLVNIELNPHHALYQGHFPDHPIVPGVCMLQFIKECTEEICQQTLQYEQIGSCKFLYALNPTENPKLQLSLTIKANEEEHIQLSAEGQTENNCFIKLKAQFIKK